MSVLINIHTVCYLPRRYSTYELVVRMMGISTRTESAAAVDVCISSWIKIRGDFERTTEWSLSVGKSVGVVRCFPGCWPRERQASEQATESVSDEADDHAGCSCCWWWWWRRDMVLCYSYVHRVEEFLIKNNLTRRMSGQRNKLGSGKGIGDCKTMCDYEYCELIK